MPAPIGAEDLYRFRWIDHVRLSPDGERAAYQLTWADRESRQNRSRVVIRRLLDQEPVEATAGPRRDHSPEWSPDGSRLAFLGRRGAVDQVFVLDVVSGDTVQLTSISEGVTNPAWSPDGSRIAFIATVIGDPDSVVDDPRPPESREQVRRAPVARIARRLDYKHDGVGYVDGRYHHLFVVPSGGGDVTQLTGGPWDVSGFDWSPDGTKLVVAGNSDPGADLRRELNLYLVDLEGKRDKLTGGFYLSSPAWSPRGDVVAFIAPNGLGAGLLERLWIVPSAGGPARCLTLGLDLAVSDSVITDMRTHRGARLSWSKDGDRIYFPASSPGVAGIYSTDLEGNIRNEVGGQRCIFDFDVASRAIAFCASDPSNPGELHVATQGAEARLTDLNPWLRERYIAHPEHHTFTSPDGWVIEGWLLKPQDFDPTQRHPLVMEIHGGPHSQYGWAFFHELQILAGMGYLVLYANPRGSDGYGEHFRRQVVRDWGGKDYVDLMTALDQLIERTGYVDTDRLGVAGGSYGGYMTNWMIGQTDRFAAAVAMRSVCNLVSEYAQHDIVIWGVQELGPPPWPDLDELWKRSPIRYVQNIRTPLLLTCAEMDLRCAISQSEELFGAMRLLGKTVEMVRFPEESHDLSRGGRPDRRVERLDRIAGWFERYLGTAAVERVQEPATMVLDTQTLAAEPAASEMAIGPEETMHIPTAQLMTAAELAALAAEAETPVAKPPVEVPEPVSTEPEPAESLAMEPVGSEPTSIEVFIAPETAIETVPAEPEAASADKAEATQGAPPAEAVEPQEPEVAAPRAEVPTFVEPRVEEEAAAAPESQPVAAEDEALPVLPEPEPVADEPKAAAAEPEAPAFEPVASAPEPIAAPEPMAQPEPVGAAAPEASLETASPSAEVAEAAAAPASEPVAPVAQTIIAWPTGTGPGGPENGQPPSEPESSEAATSLIPIWQPPDPSAAKQTVSLEALPTESLKAGAGYAATLTFESGPFAGRVIALPDQVVSVGRAPDNDVVIGDPATSGRHGRIEARAGVFWISDLGSTNGTMVNGEPIIEKPLAHGDLIAIGQNTIRFTLENA